MCGHEKVHSGWWVLLVREGMRWKKAHRGLQSACNILIKIRSETNMTKPEVEFMAFIILLTILFANT